MTGSQFDARETGFTQPPTQEIVQSSYSVAQGFRWFKIVPLGTRGM